MALTSVIVGTKPDWIRVQSSLSRYCPFAAFPVARVSGLEWVLERMGVEKVERGYNQIFKMFCYKVH